jgi:hypothetical protein
LQISAKTHELLASTLFQPSISAVVRVTVVACVIAFACVPAASSTAVAGVPLDLDILTVAGLPAFAGVPGVVGVSAVAFIPTVEGVPAADDVLAIDRFPADFGVPV